MKRNVEGAISSSSAHNNRWVLRHINICLHCVACGEIPVTFLPPSFLFFWAFLLKQVLQQSQLHLDDFKEVFNLKSLIRRSTRLRPSLRQGFSRCTMAQPPQPGNNVVPGSWFLQNLLVPAETKTQQSHLLSALQPEGFQQVQKNPGGFNCD